MGNPTTGDNLLQSPLLSSFNPRGLSLFMRFLSPGAFWWLLLAAPIIFFYLLKLRRTRQVVPSTLLWRRAVEEMQVNAPFRKLRRNLLLLLQLVVLAALALALSRPAVQSNTFASGSTVVVIDATASMSARDEQDGSLSRLDRAKQIAQEMISGMSGEARIALIEASAKAFVRSPLTSDTASLKSSLHEIPESDAAGSLRDALLLAEQLARSERDASIVLISDGGSPAGDLPISVPLRYVRVGSGADNLGIVAMNSRRVSSQKPELFASIVNFSERERAIGLELTVDGNLVDARTLTVAERASVVFDSLPESGGLARLEIADLDDDLQADNVAFAFLPDSGLLRVHFAGDSRFVLGALLANQDIEVVAEPTNADAIVVEGAATESLLTSDRPILVLNPPTGSGIRQPGSEPGQPTDITSDDAPLSIERTHPVNSYLTYAGLHLQKVVGWRAVPWLKPIVSAGDLSLIWAGNDGSRRVVVVGFDLAASDFQLKPEFPMLVANSVAWLCERNSSAGDRAVQTGQPVTIAVESTGDVSIKTPRGNRIQLPVRDGQLVVTATSEAGMYEIEGLAPFAASLLSETESDLRPRESINIRGNEVQAQAETFESEREIWTWLAIAAAMVLAIEWWLYLRRI